MPIFQERSSLAPGKNCFRKAGKGTARTKWWRLHRPRSIAINWFGQLRKNALLEHSDRPAPGSLQIRFGTATHEQCNCVRWFGRRAVRPMHFRDISAGFLRSSKCETGRYPFSRHRLGVDWCGTQSGTWLWRMRKPSMSHPNCRLRAKDKRQDWKPTAEDGDQELRQPRRKWSGDDFDPTSQTMSFRIGTETGGAQKEQKFNRGILVPLESILFPSESISRNYGSIGVIRRISSNKNI